MLQQPGSLTPAQLAEVRNHLDRKVEGLPGDIVLALGALLLLAEQGNAVARDLFLSECRRMDIQWHPLRGRTG